MNLLPVSLITILAFSPTSLFADRPLPEVLATAKVKIANDNPSCEIFLSVVTDSNFLLGLEHAISDYDDLVLLEAEKQQPQDFVKDWHEIYRPIFLKILKSKTLPEGVTISEIKHIVPVSKNSNNRIHSENIKYRTGLDLRLNINKISEEALGFSMPILNFESGTFSRN